ncbi:hypothetical protein FRB95_009283 [Tulasnella sp. JGI-2019a]|nr:hypothetical protein FRB95_009283 [Tulasnella sp. JGI-2019a]
MPVTRKASATLGNEPLSRTSSTPSTPTPSSKKKNGTSASASNGPSAKDTTSTPTISRAKSKEVIAREFVDPPKVIGNSPLKQTPSRTFVVAGPPSPNPKKSKKSTAQQKKLSSAKAASSGLWASVRYTIMVGLVTYTVVICPHDKKNDLALCRTKTDAERAWKRHIYEPYLEPRFNDLLAHPSVSRVVDPVIHHTKPVSRQVHSFLNQRSQNVYRNYLMYSALAERELHKHSQPYVKQVQRQYNTHLDPYVSQYITPTYNNHIIPVIQRMEVWGRATGRMLEPYLYRAAITIRRAAHQTEPVLAVLWSYAADVPGAIHQRAWEPLVDLRRTYVDPQVSKMMETVDEVGGEAKAAADEHVTAPTAETVEKPHDTYVT